MEDGLVHFVDTVSLEEMKSLNPCCSGQWSRTDFKMPTGKELEVLILIVVDNSLVPVQAAVGGNATGLS